MNIYVEIHLHFMCVEHMFAQMCSPVCARMEAKDQLWVSSSIAFCLIC